MTVFLDRQGKLVLALVVLLGLCYVVAFAMTRKPEVIPEDIVKNYLGALQVGDIRTAYALLSEDDREYFDLGRFKDFLWRQPQLQFLYGGSDVTRGFLVRERMSYELVENKTETNNQPGTEVLMKVTLPDIAKVLGRDLMQFYLYGEENQSLSTEQSLELSKRVEARLRTLATAPTLSSYQKFVLVEQHGRWQLSVPEWRVEAMVYEAKQKLIARETEAAGLLLEQASNFVLRVDDLTRKTFVSEAIAGKHMLRYLRAVGISGFRLEPHLSTCRFPVSLELENYGSRSIRSVNVVVQFLDDEGIEVIDHQVIVVSKESLGRRAALQATSFLPAEESVSTKLCLTPPPDWSGYAKSHLAWLTFAQEVN
jgi:hypothetical protein